jgi:hypothetical protein
MKMFLKKKNFFASLFYVYKIIYYYMNLYDIVKSIYMSKYKVVSTDIFCLEDACYNVPK